MYIVASLVKEKADKRYCTAECKDLRRVSVGHCITVSFTAFRFKYFRLKRSCHWSASSADRISIMPSLFMQNKWKRFRLITTIVIIHQHLCQTVKCLSYYSATNNFFLFVRFQNSLLHYWPYHVWYFCSSILPLYFLYPCANSDRIKPPTAGG